MDLTNSTLIYDFLKASVEGTKKAFKATIRDISVEKENGKTKMKCSWYDYHNRSGEFEIEATDFELIVFAYDMLAGRVHALEPQDESSKFW